MANERFIGVDIGGTSTRIVHSSSLEVPQLKGKTVFPTTNNFERDYQRITQYADAHAPIDGIGIGLPGDLNSDKSKVIQGNVPGYVGQPLPALLSDRYGVRTRMDNDAAVAALGEALYGTDKKEDFTYIIWGTGVGGATVEYRDSKPKSTPLDWDVHLASWEDVAGGRSLPARYGKSAEQLTEKDWQDVMDGFSDEMLVFINKLPTPRIIFGGGIAIKQAHRLEQVAHQLSEKSSRQVPKVEISKLGEDAGLYGSLGLLRES